MTREGVSHRNACNKGMFSCSFDNCVGVVDVACGARLNRELTEWAVGYEDFKKRKKEY